MIEIVGLNKKQLAEFVSQADYLDMPFVPISRHRAKSHVQNPRADEADTLLLLAYEADEMVGYLGVLADALYLNNAAEKCGWLSCMWINPIHRGKGIAKKLVEQALKDWEGRILVTEFTGPAKGLYDKIGQWNDLRSLQGRRVYIRFDLAEILPPKKPIFQKIKPLLRFLDFISNALVDLRFLFYSKKAKHLVSKQISELDQETKDFIKPFKGSELFRRGIDELQWMLDYPWVLGSAEETEESKKYHFSSIDKSFDFYPLKIYQEEKLIAFLILAKRHNRLKIPYLYTQGKEDEVWAIVQDFIVEHRIKTFTVFHPTLLQKVAKGPGLWTKFVQRKFIIGKVFSQPSGQIDGIIRDGDADCAFT